MLSVMEEVQLHKIFVLFAQEDRVQMQQKQPEQFSVGMEQEQPQNSEMIGILSTEMAEVLDVLLKQILFVVEDHSHLKILEKFAQQV